jgi:hypothetical protein
MDEGLGSLCWLPAAQLGQVDAKWVDALPLCSYSQHQQAAMYQSVTVSIAGSHAALSIALNQSGAKYNGALGGALRNSTT